jgi:alcohol dehydrogenase
MARARPGRAGPPHGRGRERRVTGDTTETPIRLDRLLYNETRLQGVFTFDTHATRRNHLAQRGAYPFERLATHHYPLERAQEAIRAAGREIDGVDPIKVVITPDGRS